MKTHKNRILKNQKGQSLIEYLIIVALIAVGSIGVVRVLGQNIYGRFANISNALQGNSKAVAMDKVSDSQTKKRDLNDFFKTAGKHSESDGHED